MYVRTFFVAAMAPFKGCAEGMVKRASKTAIVQTWQDHLRAPQPQIAIAELSPCRGWILIFAAEFCRIRYRSRYGRKFKSASEIAAISRLLWKFAVTSAKIARLRRAHVKHGLRSRDSALMDALSNLEFIKQMHRGKHEISRTGTKTILTYNLVTPYITWIKSQTAFFL